MPEKKIFVGRKAELEQFLKVLEDPQGQAILVVGQAGMGKTWLVNKMAELAESHPKLKCGWVRYEVTPTDSVDSTMALMMDNAFEAAQLEEGSFVGTKRRLEQWRSLLNVINIGDLVMSLRRDPSKNTRDQFLERLRLISRRMPKNGRAIFIIDPEKYMQKDSDQSWAIVVKELPEKIKFVFGQRPEDVLVESETFGVLDNLVCISDKEKQLGVLEEESVDELIDLRARDVGHTPTKLRNVLSRYEGHPYALVAAMDLLEAGTKLEELPKDPTGIAESQWKELSKRGKDAIRLFKSYAILEVGVSDEILEKVSGMDSDTRQSLIADNYLGGLLREEGAGKRIYHAILADYILGQIGDKENKDYHSRAVEVYREKLKKAAKEQTKPDALAATRLAEHVLASEGKTAFVYVFVNECTAPLLNLGLLDAAMNFSKRALGLVEKDSEEEGVVTGNLGLIYQTRGQLDKAEEMHNKSLEIDRKLGRFEGMAGQYGNLGLIYCTRGELDKAEEMFLKIVEIHTILGSQEGLANDYGNLGLIYETKGQLDKAEEMFKESLEISEQKGMMELTANQYGNLGLIYETKGQLDKAEDMHRKALEINEKLGRLEGMAKNYGNLGLIYMDRRQLDRAEEVFREGLKIDEKLGRLEGVAAKYSNLGGIYEKRGDVGKAREYWEKALELYKKIGMPHMVEKVEKWINSIDK